MKHAVSMLSGCLLFAACAKQGAATLPPAPPPKVTVTPVQFVEVTDYGEHTGWLKSSNIVEVRALVRGYLDKVHFRDGQLVKKGDLLFELDQRPFQMQLDASKAMMAALEAQHEVAVKEAARQRSLLARGGASQSLVDKLEADAKALMAQVESKEQEVARAALDLEYAKLTAPIDGRIGAAQLTPGNLVNAGGSDPLLATIVAIDPVYAYFTIDERGLQTYRRMRLFDPAQVGRMETQGNVPFEFALDIDKGYPHRGTVDFAAITIDNATGTITVRGTVENELAEFVSGSRIRVRIATEAPRKAAVVPDEAILADQDRRYVLLVDKDNVVKRRDVQLGKLLDDGQREVTPRVEGAPAFAAGDRVISAGLLRARVEERVDPVLAQ